MLGYVLKNKKKEIKPMWWYWSLEAGHLHLNTCRVEGVYLFIAFQWDGSCFLGIVRSTLWEWFFIACEVLREQVGGCDLLVFNQPINLWINCRCALYQATVLTCHWGVESGLWDLWVENDCAQIVFFPGQLGSRSVGLVRNRSRLGLVYGRRLVAFSLENAKPQEIK